MKITIREKNAGPSLNIKKNNEEVMASGGTVPEAAPVEETEDEIKKVD